jgi:hypothetical protein
MFQAYIAIDPSMWWDDQALTARAERIFAKPDARRGSVYISQAHPLNIGDGDPNLMRDSSSAFAAVLANAETPAFRTELQYFADENHGSVPLISLYRGLLHVFDGYNMPLETVVEDPTAVSGHFERISKRLGIKLLPPESVVNDLGYFLLRQIEDPDGAIVLFELNVANYPESANVYDSLGEAYAAADNMQRAIESYEKSLSLDPDNENAANRLEELRKPAVPDQQGTQ